ncbi:MAG: AAA family ATPase [Eggerthia catenaformis]|uniref:AAA family ATPase n=1 Tax=Eggerthia catenaformis TaxID=31973 RepID=UPI003F9F44D2
MENVKINSLELENVKRIKAVELKPDENGLTVIGGENNNGKTSVLDAIAWALGGNRFKPSRPEREGSMVPPKLKVTLSNGIIVERIGKNSTLKVTDPTGKKAGQNLLDSFISELALDLPKFLNSSNKEKSETLLKIIGVGEQLNALDQQASTIYNDRLAIGRIADQKAKYAKEMESYEDVPNELLSASDLIKQQQDILAKNGENARKRARVEEFEQNNTILSNNIKIFQEKLKKAQEEYDENLENLRIAKMDAMDLIDESTKELEENIAHIDEVNRKIRINLDKERAEEEAKEYQNQYSKRTKELERVRKNRTDLLKNANLPLPELSIDDEGHMTYQNQEWDNMSGSQQLKVATSIIRKLNPKCGFVLLDKLEQMDMKTLKNFGEWIESEGLQAIATRVSTGDECSVIIEDGYIKNEVKEEKEDKKEEWTW